MGIPVEEQRRRLVDDVRVGDDEFPTLRHPTSFWPHVQPRTAAILLYTALALTFQYYFGSAEDFEHLHAFLWTPDPERHLYGLLWWAFTTWASYMIVPILYIKLRGGKLSDWGLRRPLGGAHLWLYAALYLGAVPFLVAASGGARFLHTYPFYQYALDAPLYWFIFEIAYMLTFVSVEFFFRGFLLFGLQKELGDAAVFVAAVPYCMIHFGKPLPETMAAILGAVILGTLALRTRSIFGGVVVHQLVAITMDLLAVYRKLS